MKNIKLIIAATCTAVLLLGQVVPKVVIDGSGNASVNGVKVTGTPGVSYVPTANASSTAVWKPQGDLLTGYLPPGTVSNEVHKNLSISNGVTSTILATVTGTGYISELFVATNKYNTEVIVTVDGEGTPQIDANVCDLLADHYCDTQPAAFNQWVNVSNNGSNNAGGTLRIPIPFSTSIKVELKNNSGSTAVITSHVIVHTGVTDSWVNTQHLHLVLASVSGIAANAETDMVNVTPNKPGRLAGFGWIYDGFPGGASPRSAPLEGAFKVYIDGSGTAAYAVGGSEDMFGMPWYFANTSVFGNTIPSTLSPASSDISVTVNNVNTWGAQRFFIHDPLTFSTGLRMTWICGNTSAVSFTGTCSMFTAVYYYTEN